MPYSSNFMTATYFGKIFHVDMALEISADCQELTTQALNPILNLMNYNLFRSH